MSSGAVVPNEGSTANTNGSSSSTASNATPVPPAGPESQAVSKKKKGVKNKKGVSNLSNDGSKSSSSGQAKKRASCNPMEGVKSKKIRRLFETVAEHLSETARLIEGWEQPALDSTSCQKTQSFTKKLKKHLKKSTTSLGKLKQALPACKEYQMINIPASLITHVDQGRSPGEWVKRLVERCKTESELVHGELYAITNFRLALQTKLQEMGAIAAQDTAPSDCHKLNEESAA